MKEWKNKNSGNSSNKKGKNSSNQSNTTMDLKKARIRFIEIANKTGIHGEETKQEPNPKEREELWDITRSFLARIYTLDDKSNLSKEEVKEYNELCYWSVAALHWNDYVGQSPTQYPGRFRRDTIALALCLYIRISKDYEVYENIKTTFIKPHLYGSVILWICSEMKIAESDIYFDKFDIEFIKKADEQRRKFFFDRGGLFLNKEDNEKDYDKIVEILYELLDTFSEEDGRSFSKFILTYIKTLKELLPEDLENNTKYIESTLLSSSTPESTEDIFKEVTLNMLQDNYSGKGKYTYDNGDVYVGDFKDSRPHGKGTYTFKNGDKNSGEWKQGKMHGFGIEEIGDGGIYKGEYKEDKKDGFGELTWPDGDSYIGEFSNGEMNGKGIFKTGDKEYSGTYKDGKLISKDPVVDFSLKVRNIALQKEHGLYEEKETGDLNKAIEKMQDGSLFEEKEIHPKPEKTKDQKEKEALEKLGTTKKDLAEKVLKNISVSQENPEAYAFVKAVSAKGANMQDILNKYEHILDDHINFADEDGYTAMHYACWDNKRIILEMLIDFGANPNVVSPTNETPLNMAVVSGHFDIVKFFVDYDVEMELNIEWEKRNTTPNPFHPEKGSTLIRDAILNQHWDIFDLLINGIAPHLDVLTEPCSVGFEGEKNFFLAIEKLYQKENIDYDKKRLETIRSTVEGSSNQETNNEEDDNKGYPMITVRNFKDKNGNNDTEKQKLVKEYMMKWHEPTELYNRRAGITARIPDFFQAIDKSCPKWTSGEIINIKNYITKYKVIPSLNYAPEEFNNWTKQVWWLAPFVFIDMQNTEVATWLFIDKNGFHAAKSDNEGFHIFSWDIITDTETEWLENNLVMLTLFGEHNDQDIELRICEFVSEGNGSYLEVIESIYSVYEKTIEASRGGSTWSHGAGGEGYEGFDNPKELLDEKKWKAVEPTNPSLYGSSFEEIKTVEESTSKEDNDTSQTRVTMEMIQQGFDGRGLFEAPDGSKYEGDFKVGRFSGKGKLIWPDGENYDGDWKDGNPNGKGIYNFINGDVYDGEFKNGEKSGSGKFTHGPGDWEGDVYEGEFKNDQRSGHGVITFGSGEFKGEKYDGQWKDDKRNGKGTYYFTDGTSFMGTWKDGECVEKEVELKTENKVLSKDASIWEIIQYEFINLDKESVVKKDFSEMILKKYPHIKKGTLGAQISIQVINKRGRTNYAQCSKERVCGDNKYDFLFENDDKTLCKYDKDKHGIWEIYKREDGKLDVRSNKK